MVIESRLTSGYRICTRCIMDTSDPDISFNERGECSNCQRYYQRVKNELHIDEAGQQQLQALVSRISEEGKQKPYDCLIGLSGGVDSSTVAHIVKELGLRPLAVHLDNGWNSELAVHNVETLVKKLNLDLHTIVLDWEMFRDLHLAFLKASVTNSEIPTDHAITAALYKLANQYGIRYIISGSNLATEGILPFSYGYNAIDWKHLKAIHKRFGAVRLRDFPHMTLPHWAYYTFVKNIKAIPILNYFIYDPLRAKRMLAEEYGWRDYGGKHSESLYTRFFQCYILPTKFGIDKRRAHLSTLICSQQLNREDALEEMEKPPYVPEMLSEDKRFVVKKLGLTEEEFEHIMAMPPRPFTDYPNNHFWFKSLNGLVSRAKRRVTSAT